MNTGSDRRIKPEPVPAEDGLAAQEAVAFAEGRDLSTEAAEREHDRTQELRDTLVRGIKWLFWIIFALIVLMIITWVWHLLTPEKYHYLATRQLEQIQTILFSGVTAAVLSGVAQKYFLK